MRLTQRVSPQGTGQDGPRQPLPSERAGPDRKQRPAASVVLYQVEPIDLVTPLKAWDLGERLHEIGESACPHGVWGRSCELFNACPAWCD